jgi:alpha-1,3-rhamnosyl/mannosyltransferase
MLRGTPVACSRISAIPEVAGDAAEYFDPLDTAGIGAAVERLLGDGQLRERLREDGLKQAEKFSWEAAATATIASYERALAGSSTRS